MTYVFANEHRRRDPQLSSISLLGDIVVVEVSLRGLFDPTVSPLLQARHTRPGA